MSAETGARVRTDPTDAVLEAVHRRIGTQKFNAWFKNAAQVSVENEDVKVGAANPFIAGWIESHFAEDLAAASREVTGRRRRVTVSVDPTLSGRLRGRQLDVQANLVDRGTAGTARQKLAPAPRLRYELGDFVTGTSNKLAYSAALSVAQNSKVTFNPL
ncbi:MAG: hypothetical protein KAV00_07520, partial [Phycisphaerae bacterium]|nr:hypothetical protein [Phycisphaerae bacterium]